MSVRSVVMRIWLLVAVATQVTAAEPVDFGRQVRPILSQYCFQCHGPDANARQAELRLDVPTGPFANAEAKVIVRGQPAQSELFKRIMAVDPEQRMPPLKTKMSLSAKQKEILGQWIQQGANYQQHWSFVVPVRPALPPVKTVQWPQNAIDSFILSRLEQAGLQPQPVADRATLIRRLTFDLTGLPPTLEEIDEFESDPSPQAYEKLVDRLLSSSRYGEHMAWNWLAAARYGDTNGYQGDRTRTMHFWRDWVARSFNRNQPFDQFTVEQLAGDLLPNPSEDQLIATGFNRNHPLNGEGGRIAEENRVEYVFDRTETTGTVWMGLTVGCARCHDHKFDPISQKEYFQLYNYFNSIAETGSVDKGGNASPVHKVLTIAQRGQLQKFQQEIEQQVQTLTRPLVQLAETRNQWIRQIRQKINGRSLQGWTVVEPTSAKSVGGATVGIEKDKSILVIGKFPKRDDYVVEGKSPLSQVTAFRLEALTHDVLNYNGPGRTANFVLTHFQVTVQQGDQAPVALKFSKAIADFNQDGLHVQGAIDPSKDKGWGVWEGEANTAQDRQAIFLLASPLAITAESRLVITLKHQSKHNDHVLGHFRISVTDVADPDLGTEMLPPADVRKILETEPANWNQQQQAQVARYHRSRSAESREAHRLRWIKETQIERLLEKGSETMVMKDLGKPRQTYMLTVGRYDALRKDEGLIHSGVPASLPPLADGAPANRLALAQWLVNPSHPLTARVAVNRLWQQIFGMGLVETTEDFGSQGKPPSHPLLLDYLATEFRDSGWNIKQLVRLIVTSATYRQSSRITSDLVQRDPRNILLGRGPRYRLPAHVIRDQALFLSGLLVEQTGGPSVKPYQPPGLWADFSFGKIKYAQDKGARLYRRSLYTFWRRSLGPPNMFDEADRRLCSVRSSRTNTPLHALTLLNDTTFVEASRVFAERLLREEGSEEQRLAKAFRMATARLPGPREQQVLRRALDRSLNYYRQHPPEAEKLLKVGDKVVDSKLKKIEVAAYATVMNIILNMDEVIARE
ncbi:MAG: PSD1 and planctomycete cytochrome C domain-containing protein [Pirellulaceae bacterium]